MICHGNNDYHCCSLGEGGVCVFLEEHTVEGRRWACGLLRRFKTWDKVHRHPLWLENVQPWLEKYDIKDCGSWPQPDSVGGLCCYEETPVSIGDD